MKRSTRRAVSTVITMATVAMLAPAQAQATFPGGVGKIATASCSTDCGVFLVDPASGNATQLTHNPHLIPVPRGDPFPASDGPSSWTPDGRGILYLRARPSDDPEPRIVNADGTGDQPFPAAQPFDPVFSPDGSKLAYVGFTASGYPQIFVRNVDGSGVQQLTHGETPGSGRHDPDWSPDGTKIAFTGPGPGTDIYVMNADGTDQRRLLNSVTMSGWDPSWSPDGSKLAFTGNTGGGNYDIFVINSDGSGGPVNLTNSPVGPPFPGTRIDDEEPAWSPDGKQIAFTRTVGNPIRLMVMNADGSGTQEVPAGGPFQSFTSPIWQSIPAPRRTEYKNASHFCKAERQFWGAEAFQQRYGGGPNAHGRCVSRS